MGSSLTDAEIESRFRYHAPTPEARKRHEAITEASIAFAKVIRDNVPDCAELYESIDELVIVRMIANAGIATNHDKL